MSKRILSIVVVFALASLGCDEGPKAPPPPTPQVDATAAPSTQPIIPVVQMIDWCPEHAMPESICVQCNQSLAAAYKAKGDWDQTHNVPKSQCFQCDPALKEKFATAFKAQHGKEPPTGGH
jgi:hypothetical protein